MIVKLGFKLSLIGLLICSFQFGCGNLGTNSPDSKSDAAVSASIKFSHTGLAIESITKIVLIVSHSEMDTIRKEMSLGAGGASLQLQVPTGKLLTFTATAYRSDTAILSGTTQFEAESGKTAAVSINLDFLVPALILTPPDSVITQGEEITAYIEARQCTDLGTVGAKITFDRTKLQVKELGREDAFLKSNSGSINQLKFFPDNANGTIDIVLGIFPSSAAVSGSGKIGKIVFTTVSTGTATISLSLDNTADSDLGLYDKNANLIDAFSLGSSLEIQ